MVGLRGDGEKWPGVRVERMVTRFVNKASSNRSHSLTRTHSCSSISSHTSSIFAFEDHDGIETMMMDIAVDLQLCVFAALLAKSLVRSQLRILHITPPTHVRFFGVSLSN